MKMQVKNTLSITLSVISMVLILLCTVLPIFSFWNYRLCMIPFACVSILCFLADIKERSKKTRVLIACFIFSMCGIAYMLGSSMKSVVICTVLSVYAALLLLLPKTNKTSAIITSIFAVVAGFLQFMTITEYFNNYDLINSGAYPEIPSYVADNMLIAGFNEIGMIIVIACLICSTISIQCNRFVQVSNSNETETTPQ